jgi:hypothetical protein
MLTVQDETKNAAPASEQESGKKVNNRDSIPTDHYTTNGADASDGVVLEQSLPARLLLFRSKSEHTGDSTNTAFEESPTEICQDSLNVFCRDHTPIAFKGGMCRGDNFDYATAVPFDIDNSNSDNPLDWISPESIIGRLTQLGINFWMVASRNHLRPKDGKAPRPKFHVYLPLAAPLYDGDKFVRYCDWCIKTFGSDPQVKSKSQKIFGYGDNPNPFIESGDGGHFIDEILTDADLAAVVVTASSESAPAVLKKMPPLPPAVRDYFNAGVFPSGNKRDFDSLKQHLAETGQTFAVAQMLCGLNDGRRPDDPEHHQPCPILDCKSDDDGFYSRGSTFHCRKCGFNGDIFDLVGKVHAVIPSVAFDMIAVVRDSLHAESSPNSEPSIPTIPQNTEEHSGEGNSGNAQNDILYQYEFQYSDERGFRRYRIIRNDFIDANGEPHKEFIPIFRDAEGNTVFKEPEILYPYRLPEVLHSDMVFIVEGEKCADWLSVTFAVAHCEGIAVTTSQGGAQRGYLWQGFLQRYPAIAEKTIRILPDNDAAGMNYARTVAAAFLEANPSADVKIVELPGLSDGGDYVDWHDHQVDIGNDYFPTFFQSFWQLHENAAPVTPSTVKSWKQSEPKSGIPKAAKSKQKQEEWDKMLGTVLTASEVLATDWGQLGWIVDGVIPEGLTVFAGQSKIGKSWFLLQMAICVAMCRRFLKSFETSKYEILYIALEDNERRMKSRLQRLKLKVNDGLKIIHTWTDQWDALDYFLENNPLVKVVIIDTWGRFVTGVCKDGNDYAETTELAANLHNLARKHKAAIIAVTHTKKGTQGGDWIDDAIGSKALVAVADTIIKLSRDRNEKEGTLYLTGRDVEEKEFTLEHDDNWLWHLSESQGLTQNQRKILKRLKESSVALKVRDLQQNIAGFSKAGGAERMEAELLSLLQMGRIKRNGDLWFIQQDKTE